MSTWFPSEHCTESHCAKARTVTSRSSQLSTDSDTLTWTRATKTGQIQMFLGGRQPLSHSICPEVSPRSSLKICCERAKTVHNDIPSIMGLRFTLHARMSHDKIDDLNPKNCKLARWFKGAFVTAVWDFPQYQAASTMLSWQFRWSSKSQKSLKASNQPRPCSMCFLRAVPMSPLKKKNMMQKYMARWWLTPQNSRIPTFCCHAVHGSGCPLDIQPVEQWLAALSAQYVLACGATLELLLFYKPSNSRLSI